MSKFLPQFLVVLAVSLSFALFRRFAPRNSAEEHVSDNGKRLPYGVAGACMWLLGIAIAAGGFFALRTVNHLWSHPDHNTLFVAYPPQVIWMFLPGFAALAIPWVFALWLLRRFGYAGQAAEIVENGNQKGGFNCERVMKWLIWIIVVPIGLFTLPAIPMHLAVKSDQALLTHYGHIFPDRFYFSDARHAYWVQGYYVRNGRFISQPDLLITFADGRRLHANAVGDGGSVPSPQLVSLLLARTGLAAIPIKAENDIPTSN